MKISNDILYVGVNDHDIDLFEGHYIVPEGMAYNSYVIKDEKTAVMDSVDGNFTDAWIANVKEACGSPDYLVVQHMEPDHSGSVRGFMEAFPEAKIVSSAKAFTMMNQFFGINGMPTVPSTYWNDVHGYGAEDVFSDKEGVQTIRNMAENMVFLMRSIRDGAETYGIPEEESGQYTNFIR